MSQLRWSELEGKIELAELPAFHRAFLNLHRPELQADGLPLRRVQQYVTQTLYGLVKAGQATQEGEDFLLSGEALPPQYRGLM